MNFNYHVESIDTPALRLDYHLVPWDTEILGKPVAQIAGLRVRDPTQATHEYQLFAGWCARQRIELCACRVPAERVADSMFLEEQGFRSVELNYLPHLSNLQDRHFDRSTVEIALADLADRESLADMAAQVLRHGRFHQDPRIDPALGARRYRAWMINAFARPQQRVLKCLIDGVTVGFFVVEHPEPKHCFWSLVGLAPGLQGQGLGKRVWNAMLGHLRAEGMETVSTSISSHNVAAFNLYVALGFRFPAPSVTLQWRPPGSGILS
jgi:ribosomal protein S18 acetylase RimI-like enzyme